MDVSKAFDKVWHEGLFYKLKQLGICGNVLNWIKDYLSNRSQKVVINGKCSNVKYTSAGVFQGSILGPLLFLVQISNIDINIESDIKLFADDTTLIKTLDNNDPFDTFKFSQERRCHVSVKIPVRERWVWFRLRNDSPGRCRPL